MANLQESVKSLVNDGQTSKTVAADQERLLQRLAEAGGKLTAEEDVEFRGTKIVLPAQMDLRDALNFLYTKLTEDEQEMNFARTYNYRPWDGARATLHALKKAFGMVRQKGVMSLFGEIPPALITIPIGPKETDEVPWGGLQVPLLPGATIHVGFENHPELGPLFRLTANGPRKYRHHIAGIFNMVEEELKQGSLYRGKAFDGQEKPEFLDLSGVDPAQVIYAEETTTQLEANVWSLLRYSDRMRELRVPLKRAVLFEGPYGTGKTLGAYLTAMYAVEHGWTFVYCRPGRDNLKEVMATARLYQPAVVFFEDVDTVASDTANVGQPDHVAELLDIFDGIQAKGTEILCVLTTNHVEKIHKGVMRPGRLDAIIHVGELDHAGTRRMIEASVRPDLISESIDWQKIGESMEGFLPAFTREAIDRAMRYNMARNEGNITQLETEDFVHAADGLRPQLDMMEGAKETAKPDALSTALGNVVGHYLKRTKIVDKDGDEFWQLAVNDT